MATDAFQLEENKQIVRRLHEEAWNEGNMDTVDELLTKNYVEHNPSVPDQIRGPEAYKGNVSAFRDAFSGFEIVAEDVIAEGNIVVYRHTGRGTHDGEFMGIEPTGNSFEVSGVVLHRIEVGQIAEAWVYVDVLGLLAQLGVVTPPGADVGTGNGR